MRKFKVHSIRDAQIVSYIHTIIYNAATNYYERETAVKQGIVLEDADDANDRLNYPLLDSTRIYAFTPSIIALRFESGLLIDQLSILKDWELLLLSAKYILKLSDREISEYFKISQQAVTKRRNRLLKRLSKSKR